MRRNFTMDAANFTKTDGNGTLVVQEPEIVTSATFVIFWMFVFIGFIFSFVTTICLLFTKEVRRGDVYITLGMMTFSELIVYVTFLILLGLSTFPGDEPIPYLCLVLNTIVGLFKGFSLSLAIYLTTERVMAVACPRAYRFSKMSWIRSIVQSLFFVSDVGFFFAVNFNFGKRDSDFGCTMDIVYQGSTDRVMKILRANSIVKMAVILIMCAVVSILIRRKMKAVIALGDVNVKVDKTGMNGPETRCSKADNKPSTLESTDNGPSCSFQRDIFASTTVSFNKEGAKPSNWRPKFLYPYPVSASRLTGTDTTNLDTEERSNNDDASFEVHKSMEAAQPNRSGKHGKANTSKPKPKKMPFWMRESYKTVSYYLLSYVVVYLPSIIYMTTMLCFSSIKEDGVSRGINFLTPCVHSIVASFIYIFRVREMSQGLRCIKRNSNESET